MPAAAKTAPTSPAIPIATPPLGSNPSFGCSLLSPLIPSSTTSGVFMCSRKTGSSTGLAIQSRIRFCLNDWVEQYRSTGKERDAETGLDYFGARYFSGAQGRFTSADPKQMTARHLTSPQKWNKYSYVQNNPLARIDPDGLDDYKVFITANAANPGGWDNAKQVLESRGHTLQVFTGGEATLERFVSARSDPGARVVFVGHSIGPSIDSDRTGIRLGDNGVLEGKIAQKQPLGGTPGAPWDAGSAKSNTVALFACQSADIANDYSGTNFFGMFSGTDHVTDLATMGSTAFAFVVADALARPADGAQPNTFVGPLDPLASANGVLAGSPLKMNEGDRLVQYPAQEVKQQ
jgi:RHS repeat-associated protein